MKFAWIDVRTVPEEHRESVIDAAVHARLAGIVSDDPALLAALPPTVTGVLITDRPTDALPTDPPAAGGRPAANPLAEGARPPTDGSARGPHLVVVAVDEQDELDRLTATAAFVRVGDDRTLRLACAAAVRLEHTVVAFTDPTKIPLEIVIAAADGAAGRLVTVVADLAEAAVVLDVLEHGPDGVLLAPRAAADVFALARLLADRTPPLALTTLVVEGVTHNGLGDRVCVDTCSHFREDEGILVGSYSSGFILCCSETHPLPYMPTRPFRVNAGALHSYVLGPDNRTNYLSELRSGSTVLAVDSDGRTRKLTVGRAKLESRPVLTVTARSPEGVAVSLTAQDDWHVRVLGPGGKVRNVTELRPGDELLGYLATEQRHVGLPIGEFCKES
ncbi:3-dehydroquinate synthase II family protein [Saccharothrix australiensis]|uniref:3-amino-4-hydroxybenzoic acid synthase n=1 Tax=Saccharothrix australiensis TaxID=2072 RepID=A0A495W748_9PSEU|nr:3-dehydroquinate synthase II [Saccharothrix australiensis]RKT56463.1 3-amino-4-hydroxybenzoic acid synthase [Saccharothrix australiensis]